MASLWPWAAGVALGIGLLYWMAPDVAQSVLLIALRLLVGGAVIYGADLLAQPYGLHIGLNPVTAAILGFLGVPGAAVLLLWHGIYG
jgi:inhibitor of the pro-sigma K processing machinery